MEPPKITLRFHVACSTKWGESVVLCGPRPLLGNLDLARAQKMECLQSGGQLVWETELVVTPPDLLTYKYALVNSETLDLVRWEAEAHTLTFPDDLQADAIIQISDVWEDTSHPAQLLSRAVFRKTVLLRSMPSSLGDTSPLPPLQVEHGHCTVRLQIKDWQLEQDQQLCVTGGAPQLGSWQLQESLPMQAVGQGKYEVEVHIPYGCFPLTYKYCIWREDDTFELEIGENRLMPEDKKDGPTVWFRNDSHFRHERRWRGAGVAVPVFSLRTERSIGCGDFRDLIELGNFCHESGLCLVQLLPVNDTRVLGDWRDSYPYSSLCVFALHPLYLSLQAIKGADVEEIRSKIEVARNELDLMDVDYEATVATKIRIARMIFDRQYETLQEDEDFRQFCLQQEDWLKPYALFCYFQSFFGTSNHTQWGVYSAYDPKATEKFFTRGTESSREIFFSYFLQYNLHLQLLQASWYLRLKGVVLKGDLPIGVDKWSVDTWLYPNLFHMDTGTGSPPDYFNADGQNWGFPTYNWEEMAKDDYSWWRRRLVQMALYFQAYRVDHIIGFFRIWEIPGVYWSGLMGHFRPSLPVTRSELESRGLWDIQRYCDPYVTASLLAEKLGDYLAAEVVNVFFEPSYGDRLKFKQVHECERTLLELEVPEGMSGQAVTAWEEIRKTLIEMRRNVLLLRDPEEPDTRFYPRFELFNSSSFAALNNPGWAMELRREHDDYFYNRQEEIWRHQGHRTLPVLLSSTDMLVCGEDLGFTPACVRPTMAELGIMGLRIQRMPSEDVEFGDPSRYPYMTVCSPSSHDTTTTRAWYEEDPARRQRYYTHVLGGKGTAPEACTPEIMRAIAQQHVDAPSALTVFPIQDLLALETWPAVRPALEETVNNPVVPRHYWRYRMHVTLREMDKPKLLSTVQKLLLSSGRCFPDRLPALHVDDAKRNVSD